MRHIGNRKQLFWWVIFPCRLPVTRLKRAEIRFLMDTSWHCKKCCNHCIFVSALSDILGSRQQGPHEHYFLSSGLWSNQYCWNNVESYPRGGGKFMGHFKRHFRSQINIIWIIQTGSYQAINPKLSTKGEFYHISVFQCARVHAPLTFDLDLVSK